MKYEKWEKYYSIILKDFGFSQEADAASARLLSRLLKEHEDGLKKLPPLIEGRGVAIYGGAVKRADINERWKGTIIAADDAASILLSAGITPHIIVTDLDGNVDEQIKANSNGAVVVVHAHGDNIEAIKRYVPRFSGPLVGTTQTQPLENVHNFGGFTDGDRAVFLARHFSASDIHLIGFDFENVVYKTGKDPVVKRRKLQWAKRLIEVAGIDTSSPRQP